MQARPAAVPAHGADDALDSVALIARLLDELAMAPSPMGVTELARALGESKARVYRNLHSLKSFGLVDQERASEKYRLGWKLFQLGERAALQFDLRELSMPYLRLLRELTGQSALLSVPLNGEALVIAAADNEANVSITVKPGNRPQSHCSAQGRIALAFASEAERERLLAGELEAFTPHSITDASKIRWRLELIRKRLYEQAPNEAIAGINVLAAPVLRDGGAMVGMIGIIGAIQHVPARPDPKQLKLVQGAAAALSEAIGGTAYAERGIGVPAELRGLDGRDSDEKMHGHRRS
jgi:DNA-binding IclR family transcriptional regulator